MSDSPDKGFTAFKQLGFVSKSQAGNNEVGDCIFCGGISKMYVNPSSKMWDCKKCGAEGGFKSLLKHCARTYKRFATQPILQKLAEARQLPVEIFKANDMGYIPSLKAFILPVHTADGADIWDIRIYRNNAFMSTSGCTAGLFGWDMIENQKTIYLCEGEWDKMAMEVMLEESNQTDAVVLSVPGALTFKREWATYFDKKEVVLCYDNDEPGKKGANKVGNILKGIAKSIKYVIWQSDLKDGYDVRDYLMDNDKKKATRWTRFVKLFDVKPPFVETTDKDGTISTDRGSHSPANKLDSYDGAYVPREEIHAAYRKWLHLPNTDVLDVLYGAIIANRLEGDPLWLFLVAPPGGSKTELINSMAEAPNILTTSSLTPRSLVSGANTAGGGDPSLIPRLDQKTLLVKDFTTILNMNQLLRDEIFGILRDAYDGKTEKDFGNGVRRSFKSKFGLISGVTPVIDVYTEGSSSLGERFLRYDIQIPNGARERQMYLSRAEDNAGHENEMRQDLVNIGTRVLAYDFKEIPSLPPKIKVKLIAIAQFVSTMRGTVVRDRYTGEATHQAFAELGTRMVKQFTKMLYGIGMYRGIKELTMSEYKIVCQMGMSTIPKKMEMVVKAMWDEDAEADFTTKEVADILKLPANTVSRVLDNLMMLGMMKREISGLNKVTWKLSDDAIYLIDESEIYS